MRELRILRQVTTQGRMGTWAFHEAAHRRLVICTPGPFLGEPLETLSELHVAPPLQVRRLTAPQMRGLYGIGQTVFGASMHQTDPREIRLRRPYAEFYPDLLADRWLPISRWVEGVVLRARRQRGLGEPVRTFDSGHFEFRGGAPPRGLGEQHLHTRAEDQ